MPTRDYLIWTTFKEHAFIDNLGSWGEGKKNRAELLKKYLQAAKNRTNWCGVDSGSIISRVASEI